MQVRAGCEIHPQKRAMYEVLCGHDPSDDLGGSSFITHDLEHLPKHVGGQSFDGVIGGPSCQSHSKLRAMRDPKYPDLTPLVHALMFGPERVAWRWFIFENVVPIDLPGAVHTRCNAMHYFQPHQSRERWFTHSANVLPPQAVYRGSVDDLMAYSVVAGRIYGPKRGARLQGYPAAADLPFPCVQLQHGLADAVPYPLALAWARSVLSGLRPDDEL